jgi:hypothetical protein
MTPKRIASLMFAIAVISEAATAGFFTGNQLNELCKSANQGTQNACHGFLMGVADTLNGIEQMQKESVANVCLPEMVTGSQLALVWDKWTKQNPEGMHFEAWVIAMLAFSESFPCPASQQ